MAHLAIEGAFLVIRLSWLERLGAFSGEPRVPLSAIREVRVTASPWKELKGMRAPGAGWPGTIALGTWRHDGVKDFCAVYRKGPGVVVELENARYARFVVSATDPTSVVQTISQA
jgi:hypothetical protein